MTQDRNSNRTQGETHGQAQQPVEAGDRDTTQREQEAREGQPVQDPSAPDADVEDSLRMARSPDEEHGQSEGQAGSAEAGMPAPTTGGESQSPGNEFVPRDED